MEKHSRYQQKIIKNYYQNREGIAVQRLQELVTELFLAEGKKREKLWDQVTNHLEHLGTPASQIEHLRSQNDPQLLAKYLQPKA
jgi:hypothetical protein